MKAFRACLLSVLIALCTPSFLVSQECVNTNQRDEITDFQPKIEKAISSTLYLFVENFIIVGDENDPFRGGQNRIPLDNSGRGFVIEDGGDLFIVTLSHIVRFDAEYTFSLLKQHPQYKDSLKNKVLVSKSHKIFAGTSYDRSEAVKVETKPVAAFAPFTMSSGQEDAIVLLKVPKKLASEVNPAEMVRSEKCLGINTAAWQVGGELGQDKDFGFNKFDVIATSVTNTASDKFFKTLRPSWNGASGSPVFAYHNDKLKVVGITQGWTGVDFKDRALPTQSLIYRIDPTIEILSEF